MNEDSTSSTPPTLLSTFIEVIRRGGEPRTIIRDTLTLIRKWLGIPYLMARLRIGDDFPIFCSLGYPKNFLRKENHLRAPCAERREQPLDCLCGLILSGSTHFPVGSIRTPGGSLLVPDLERLTTLCDPSCFLESTLRTSCLDHGSRALLLVPLRNGNRLTGLLHLANPDSNFFSPEMALELENCATFLAMVLDLQLKIDELREAHDLLENRALERTADLEKARNEAEAANHAQSIFLANMSHEMRTPMHGILGHCELALEDLVEGDLKEARNGLQIIQASGERLLGLLNNLLDLARLEAGKMDFHFEEEPLVATLRNAIETVSCLGDKKSMVLEFSEPDCDSRAKFDRDKICQVLVNVLGNAVKFSPPGSKIMISLTRLTTNESMGKIFEIRVRDEGPGIPKGELETIFGKFVQSSRTEDGSGGTGLGLAISRELLSAHGGKILARNNPEGGSTFIITLPARSKEKKIT